MPDDFYPSVDTSYIIGKVELSDKLAENGIVKIGSTITFVSKGPQAIYKRITQIRELAPNNICLEQATAVAIKFNFLSELLVWLESHKNWKDGAYMIPRENVTPQP